MKLDYLLLEQIDAVALIRLNRPLSLNALCAELAAELAGVLDRLEQDRSVRAVVLTGTDTVFAAGADIMAMRNRNYIDVYTSDFVTVDWERLASFRKPVIAAVAGYALGGGCEMALMCDFIIAAESARFGQPEIKLGTIPGAGGSQRLAHFIGKAKAMDMVLTGRTLDAHEAERCGLVSRVVSDAALLNEALRVAARIAGYSGPVAMMAKEAVNGAFETTLSEGVRQERRLFHSTFAIEDQKEGMAAFAEKREPQFMHR
ncbi:MULTISPECIES: enoyl-CoA hydratase [Pseudomonas]|jgi:enoyl-CoA hydratase|uniref:enoyl-CoA hydratase n=2 Tax=Pseudomonas TaxID=286 RepID=A0A9X8EJG3_PSEPU|nr:MULTISPECIES: enoyl-CoA hydratase [Pseudomonas]KIU52782.1 enoyl-CoA hydratase [Pseudomonas putida]KTC23249.1 enoyl-CoA hydratase [Pseudomonas putida]MBG8559986.1 enoyl-CoA hydratase [Pseudomonas qingdaonensis]MCO7504028.1 enoyl-CoA hydratase [Pseudomonas sp. VE 267-6A]MCO7530762.1 enoyl-CoA hydratase [Pseudomonas sp. 2]